MKYKFNFLTAMTMLMCLACFQVGAATHTIIGSGTLIGQTSDLADSTFEMFGIGTLSGTELSYDYDQVATSLIGSATVSVTGFFDILTAIGEQTLVGCTGAALICDDLDDDLGVTNPFPFPAYLDGSDPNNIVWGYMDEVLTGVGLADRQLDFVAVSDSPIVPVPAAAWLFGSALGLLGWMRRKTA